MDGWATVHPFVFSNLGTDSEPGAAATGSLSKFRRHLNSYDLLEKVKAGRSRPAQSRPLSREACVARQVS